MKLAHGSLFSGFDAPSVAASWMGWKNAFHCEINPFCNEILKYWFPNSEHYEDITKTDFRQWRGRIDILTGGFPCQPFSLAGQRKGADDNRYLWPHMLRAIREIRPAWVIGENVAGILTMVQPGEEVEVGSQATLFGEDNRKRVLLQQEYVVETICKDLEREGYSVQPLLIPACAVGAPHRRDRVWFVAHCADSGTKEVRQKRKNNVLSDRIASDTDLDRCRNGKNKQEQFTQCKGTPNDCFSGKDGIVTNTNGKRCNNWSDNWKERLFYYDWKRYSEESQSEWNKRKCGTCKNGSTTSNSNNERLQGCSNNRKHPKEREKSNDQQSCRLLRTDWEIFPTQSPVCRGNDGLPFDVDDLSIPFTKWRQESVKGYGNAIVPQVILEIFKAIEEIEQLE
ncbi:DNA cytosine methyltransferase [Bacteroides ovatus]|uniref:DNA cytosine methyltransferase n=1 Tax=Bacteroides ovatus TaxID=28116 RepID=UPI000E4431CC|nr:DNA cytosine methyltransferase [Bacteroides ovatus]RGP03356.1 DNA (cytosine-5-)-methyltransferase [Bacteroides ovatus]